MAFEETLYTHSITLEPRYAWKTLTPPIMHVLVVDLTTVWAYYHFQIANSYNAY